MSAAGAPPPSSAIAGFGQHEVELVLQALVESGQPARGSSVVALGASSSTTNTLSPSTWTGKLRTLSANGSSVPPPSRSKRAWCQWQVSRPSRTRAAAQREAHVRAAVVDGEEAPLVGEHGDAVPPALTTVHPRCVQVGDGADAYALSGGECSWADPLLRQPHVRARRVVAAPRIEHVIRTEEWTGVDIAARGRFIGQKRLHAFGIEQQLVEPPLIQRGSVRGDPGAALRQRPAAETPGSSSVLMPRADSPLPAW